MMGEIAKRYPKGELTVSTGQHRDAAETDQNFPGAQIDRLPIPTRALRGLAGLLFWSRRVSAMAREQKPRFVWCDSIRPAGYAAKWTHERHGTRYGILVHGGDLQKELHKIHHSTFARRTAKALLGSAAAVVANSQWTREQAQTVLRELGLDPLAESVRVVPLGTDPEQFRPGVDTREVRARHRLEGERWVLSVARLEPYKGIDTVLRALAQVRKAGHDVGYIVVGTGKKRETYRRLAGELGIEDAVRFVGHRLRQGAPRALQRGPGVPRGVASRGGIPRGGIRHRARRGQRLRRAGDRGAERGIGGSGARRRDRLRGGPRRSGRCGPGAHSAPLRSAPGAAFGAGGA